MKKLKYEYVLATIDKKSKRVNLVTADDLDTLVGYICCIKNNVKFKAYTRAEADKIGLKPPISTQQRLPRE